VPASATIVAGQRYISFTAKTFRPAQVEVSASLNGAKLIHPVRITGLVVSELFYRPGTGATNQLQWVEIANLSDTALDLSGYSIGAGTESFMTTQVALPMMIPARGCIVVGGPESVPANYMPTLALNQDFTPDLDLGITNVAGVGLFSTTVQGMSPTLRPIDVLVYGDETTENRSLRGPDGQIAPVWQGSPAGGSIRRVNGTIWTPSATPTPGVCEVLNVAQ
jgi:hypothetical protein